MSNQSSQRSPEREWIHRSQNPWDTIGVLGEPSPPEAERISNAIRILGNPYAKLSVFPQDDDQSPSVTQHPELELGETNGGVDGDSKRKSVGHGVSKQFFRDECCRILSQYEPLDSRKTRLRPQFTTFVNENSAKSAETRKAILFELSRYDLGDSLQVHLNRERPDALSEKLQAISDAHPE